MENYRLYHFFIKFFLVIFFAGLTADAVLLVRVWPRLAVIQPTVLGTEALTSITLAPPASPSAAPLKKAFKKEVIGFLPSWTAAQQAVVKPERLTQLIYFGLAAKANGDLVKTNADGQPALEWHYLNSPYFSSLMKEASGSGTKVLVSIKSFDNATIDKLTSNTAASHKLIRQILALIETYGFDGVNIDFEYISQTSFPTSLYFNKFLATLDESLKVKNPRLILSVDLNPLAVILDKAYDLSKIGEVTDQVILMTYEYRQSDSAMSGPVAPVNSGPDEHNIRQALDSLAGRVPAEKIILGVPFYGYEWQTVNDKPKSATVPHSGTLATYARVKELIDNRQDLQINWDEQSLSPWLVYRQSGAIKQIYYDDEKSLREKLKLVSQEKLGGIAIWALGYEGEGDDLWQVINLFNQ